MVDTTSRLTQAKICNPHWAHAFEMIEAGARLIDVGGESTRPGARAVEEAEELARVLPLVRELVAQDKCWVSVDTQRASIAEACLDAGAHLINDVFCRRAGCAYVFRW